MIDLDEIAGNDPHRLKALRDSLNQLADSPQQELRELTRAVLTGEVALRTAALSSAYAPALSNAFDAFWTHYSNLSPDERRELEASAYGDPPAAG